MNTAELSAHLNATAEFLRRTGARIRKHEVRRPNDPESLELLLYQHGINIHPAANAWFGQTCDGFAFWWDSVEFQESPDEDWPGGKENFCDHCPEVVTLKESLELRGMILEHAQPCLVEANPFPMTVEGNGDSMCLLKDGTVRLHTPGNQTLESLLMVESSCDAFWQCWSEVGFQFPDSLYWPRAWSESLGSIDWRGDQFQRLYSRLVHE